MVILSDGIPVYYMATHQVGKTVTQRKINILSCVISTKVYCTLLIRQATHAEKDIGKLRVIQSNTDTIAKKYVMSVAAACIAETVTYPLDLTKTREAIQ